MQTEIQQPAWSLSRRLGAWGVHFFTMSGLIWAVLAIGALNAGQLKLMWLWLGISLVVDSIDGPMSRKIRVTEVYPWFSGAMVDNIVDYMTWTLIPALFIAAQVPLGTKPLVYVALAMILMSSMFCYANTKMKSSDWYFVGFPAAWNVIAVVMWIFQTQVALNWVVIVVFSVLTVIPWQWVHPFRVRKLRSVTATCACIWVAATAFMVALQPVHPWWLVAIWLVAGLWIILVGALKSFTSFLD